jgi:hypothetical protein
MAKNVAGSSGPPRRSRRPEAATVIIGSGRHLSARVGEHGKCTDLISKSAQVSRLTQP